MLRKMKVFFFAPKIYLSYRVKPQLKFSTVCMCVQYNYHHISNSSKNNNHHYYPLYIHVCTLFRFFPCVRNTATSFGRFIAKTLLNDVGEFNNGGRNKLTTFSNVHASHRQTMPDTRTHTHDVF